MSEKRVADSGLLLILHFKHYFCRATILSFFIDLFIVKRHKETTALLLFRRCTDMFLTVVCDINANIII